ncbi:MAG TPA: pilus assembly protein TadG-related protein [Thermomicrobiales bacterium]|nr:pilus assembly protein TadG-related protein [Thermomicrobiales bacterium]
MMKILGARARRPSPPRPLDRHDRRAPHRRCRLGGGQPGQTLVIFALASLVLLGALGLVLDSGYDLAQRRAMQNAADAAALLGTRDIKQNSLWVQGTAGATQITASQVYDDTLAIARLNGLPTSSTTFSCRFIGNADNDLGDCNNIVGNAIPVGAGNASATGVTITLGEQHPTFVMRVVGIGTSGTGATAAAHVEAIPPDGFDLSGGPFIVCGIDTVVTDSDGNPTGETISILVQDPPNSGIAKFGSDGHAIIDTENAVSIPNTPGPGYTGPWFLIHDPNNNGVAKCGTGPGNDFMGFNDQDKNAGKKVTGSPGTIINYGNGNKAGQVTQAVPTIGGCKVGYGWESSPCLMILPIIDEGDPNDKPNVNCVGWGLFYVVELKKNVHIAQLISNVTLQTGGTLTFDPTGTYTYTATRLTK